MDCIDCPGSEEEYEAEFAVCQRITRMIDGDFVRAHGIIGRVYCVGCVKCLRPWHTAKGTCWNAPSQRHNRGRGICRKRKIPDRKITCDRRQKANGRFLGHIRRAGIPCILGDHEQILAADAKRLLRDLGDRFAGHLWISFLAQWRLSASRPRGEFHPQA